VNLSPSPHPVITPSPFFAGSHEKPEMIAGKRFVICGLSRLTTRVARRLAERQAEVIVIRGAEGGELVGMLGEGCRCARQRATCFLLLLLLSLEDRSVFE
jgi:hypothetical protein